MMDWQNIIDNYLKWIKDNTFIKTLSGESSCKIIVPFLDRHNDHIEIYIKQEDGNFILTDDGYTVNDLNISGFDLNTPKREAIFNSTVNGLGVKVGENHELYTEATPSNIGQKKHYLIQAILSVNDMYTLTEESVFSLFKEDVERFFKSEEIIYSKDVKLTGKSGFDHYIDFLIPASKTKNERLIRSINMAKKSTVLNTIFSFTDIAEAREVKTNNIVIYNDVYYPAPQESLDALKNYGVSALAWSKKSEFKPVLTLIN